jgi:hypothetical protein
VENKAQLGLPEPGVPHEALEYRAAVKRHYGPGVTRAPRNADIAAAHRPRLSTRGWDHRKQLLRSGKLGGRDWVEVWPPPRDWHPSWAALVDTPLLAEPDGSDGQMHLLVDEVYDPHNGRLIERRIIKTLGHIGASAAVCAYGVLDTIDGRIDNLFQVGRFLKHAFETILPWVCDILA